MQQPMRTLVLCAALGALSASPAAEAQGILTRARQKVEERVTRRAEEGLDRAVDGAENAVVCALIDQRCIERARSEGKTPVDAQGNPIAEGPPASGAGAALARPGEGAWANYDFVPGERVIFAEDFSRDRVGDLPRRLEFVGGTMEVVESGGARWLRASNEGRFAVVLPERLPERFTIEYDITVPANWESILFFSGRGVDGIDAAPTGACCYVPTAAVAIEPAVIGLRRRGDQGMVTYGDLRTILRPESGDITGVPVRVRLHVDGRHVKLYANETRVAIVPNLDIPRENKLYFDLNAQAEVPILFGNLSVNAGGRPLYDALMADGRVVTQGILFDTGSDRIRPESTPTLNEITAMLRQHPDLRLAIEGHTDNVGQPAANQALSEKRAGAVKDYLVKQGIDAARLQPKGFGDSRPLAGNDTAEGRQTNRRVELTKL